MLTPKPQRCPQISLIDSSGVRVLQDRQSEMPDEPVPLPVAKDPETTARWIERCLAGSEPVPASLKIQMACCLVATGESATLAEGLGRVSKAYDFSFSRRVICLAVASRLPAT